MLSVGAKGFDVGRLQQALLEADESIDASELRACAFGVSTEAAVKDFQSRHLGQDGHPLSVDGEVGPATFWALDHPGGDGIATCAGWLADVTNPAVSAARSDLGKREDPDGSNDGPDLKKFQTLGRPWCALALSEWYREGAVAVGSVGGPFGVIASAVGVLSWARDARRVLPDTATARPGDCFAIVRGDGHGHVGLVCSFEREGQFFTIEGNASNAVRGCSRTRGGVTALIRPLGAMP
jgi:hypothetical protein